MNKAQLSKLTKDKLVNMLLSKEYQRKSAWRSYYDLLDEYYEMHGKTLTIISNAAAADNIPTHFINEFKEILEKYEHIFQCTICLDDMDTASLYIISTCGHKFHKDCIQEWKKTNSICPTCRKDI